MDEEEFLQHNYVRLECEECMRFHRIFHCVHSLVQEICAHCKELKEKNAIAIFHKLKCANSRRMKLAEPSQRDPRWLFHMVINKWFLADPSIKHKFELAASSQRERHTKVHKRKKIMKTCSACEKL